MGQWIQMLESYHYKLIMPIQYDEALPVISHDFNIVIYSLVHPCIVLILYLICPIANAVVFAVSIILMAFLKSVRKYTDDNLPSLKGLDQCLLL